MVVGVDVADLLEQAPARAGAHGDPRDLAGGAPARRQVPTGGRRELDRLGADPLLDPLGEHGG